MKLSGRGAFVVTYPRRAVATLVLSPELSGHALLIDDVSGRIVAEVHQDGGRAQKLAVAPGAYRVQLRGKDDIRTGLVSLGTGERTVSSADLTVRPTLAVLAKGVSYDPNPLVLSAGPEVSSSLVEGFGVSTGLRMGTDYRISERLRWVVRAEARYASTENEWWRFRQAELGLSTGLDAVVWTGERFSMVIGARGGLAAVLQESQRVDQSRLIDGWIPRASTETDGADLGPEFTAVWALEYFPWSHLGGRLYIEPSVWWMPSENQSDLRYGVSGGLSLMVRL